MQNNRQSLLTRIAIVDGLIKQVQTHKENNLSQLSLIIELNQTIKDLGISKQNLYDELAKLDFMKQFEDARWVIKQNPTHPTYYQVVSVVGKVVTLSRKGTRRLISLQDFRRDYVEANENEVLQHIKYLTDNSIKFICKPVPCDLNGLPNIVFGTKSSVLPQIATAQTESYVEPKPKNADFYMVTLKQGYGSKVYHETYEIAEAEAIRLAKQEQKKAYVLGVVAEIEAKPTTTYEVKTKKF